MSTPTTRVPGLRGAGWGTWQRFAGSGALPDDNASAWPAPPNLPAFQGLDIPGLPIVHCAPQRSTRPGLAEVGKIRESGPGRECMRGLVAGALLLFLAWPSA